MSSPRILIPEPSTNAPMAFVRIKRVGNHDLPLPAYAKPGDAGMDLRWTGLTVDGKRFIDPYSGEPSDSITLWPQAGKLVLPCGFAFEIPEGMEGQVRGRSGWTGNGVFVHIGTIDSGYRGEIAVTIQTSEAMGGKMRVKKGDRIAQLVIAPVFRAVLEEVVELSPSERGENGFGSTGVR